MLLKLFPILDELHCPEMQTGNHKSYFPLKNRRKHEDVSIHLNVSVHGGHPDETSLFLPIVFFFIKYSV